MANDRLRVHKDNGRGAAVADYEEGEQDRGAEIGFDSPREKTQSRVSDEILRLVDAARRGELNVRARELVPGVYKLKDRLMHVLDTGKAMDLSNATEPAI